MKEKAFKGCFGGVVLFIVMLVWLEVTGVGDDKDFGSCACVLGLPIVFAITLVVKAIGKKKED